MYGSEDGWLAGLGWLMLLTAIGLAVGAVWPVVLVATLVLGAVGCGVIVGIRGRRSAARRAAVEKEAQRRRQQWRIESARAALDWIAQERAEGRG